MTRENKISIIIAFGLLLFISMLIADYFADDPTPGEIPVTQHDIDIYNVPTAKTKLVTRPPLYESICPETPSGDLIHVVLKGETLRVICRNIYGDSGLAKALAEWNGFKNANTIEEGQKIACPSRNALIEKTIHTEYRIAYEAAPSPTTKYAEVGSEIGVYTVKNGDTLSELAYKLMGTSKKTAELFNLNRTVMPDPDTIYPGMELTYPLQN